VFHSTTQGIPIREISICECLIDDDPIVGLGSIRIGKETPGDERIVIAEKSAALPSAFTS